MSLARILQMINSNDNAGLAAEIRAWRKHMGMTVKDAADLLGMSKRTLEGVEAGRGFSYPALLRFRISGDVLDAPIASASITGSIDHPENHLARHSVRTV